MNANRRARELFRATAESGRLPDAPQDVALVQEAAGRARRSQRASPLVAALVIVAVVLQWPPANSLQWVAVAVIVVGLVTFSLGLARDRARLNAVVPLLEREGLRPY